MPQPHVPGPGERHAPDHRFDRCARLLGHEGVARLRAAHVVVVGIGGVGSVAVEALVRSGLGRLTMIDFDDVCLSNTNRQVHALSATIGRPKVDVMAERALAINPGLRVDARRAWFAEESAASLLPEGEAIDFLVDAIDKVGAKCALLGRCRGLRIRAVSSMGAAGRLDPTMVRVADLARTCGDPLAREVRRALRHRHGWNLDGPTGVTAVFSQERHRPPLALPWDQPAVAASRGGPACPGEATGAGGGSDTECRGGETEDAVRPEAEAGFPGAGRPRVEGTVAHVVGAFGLACASVVVGAIAGVPRAADTRSGNP